MLREHGHLHRAGGEISRLAALARDDKGGVFENTAPFLEKVFLFQRVNSSEIEKKVR